MQLAEEAGADYVGVDTLKNMGRCSSEKVSSGVDTLRNGDRCSERK